ncbi:hypothetical protein D4764_12G0006240 [Takifugu flavidus]|uniref:Uncharacterized protein n=1 Tax=Takifugu flavidus TaxID=433684 RepID=A0A5C6PBQ9_9TELE|nr:hypothetical protein D4764_12G0006240 [Takifugu flavidus]
MTRRKEVLENGDKQLGMPSQDFCWKISKKAQANIFVYASSRQGDQQSESEVQSPESFSLQRQKEEKTFQQQFVLQFIPQEEEPQHREREGEEPSQAQVTQSRKESLCQPSSRFAEGNAAETLLGGTELFKPSADTELSQGHPGTSEFREGWRRGTKGPEMGRKGRRGGNERGKTELG